MSAPRVLLVRLSALGDCLHAVPVLVALRRQLPEARIGWAIQAGGHELLRGISGVDRFHLFPRRSSGGRLSQLAELREFWRELRGEGYTVALDLQGNSKSGVVALASGADRRIGFAGPESQELNRFFVNERHAVSAERCHVVDRNLALLEALGLEVAEGGRWVLPDYEDGDGLESFLSERGVVAGGFAVVNPGTTWVTKQWPRERFAEVARRLASELGRAVVVTWGSSEEQRDAEAISEAAGDGVHLAPRTGLRSLGWLLRRAALFVGNDTGPLHLAAALGVPCVAIFGATDPRRNGPYGAGHRVLTHPVECHPCWSGSCRRGDLACLAGVEPGAVYAACRELLDRGPVPGMSAVG